MFRFTLRTLILLSFWAGAAMMVWHTREPWTLVEVIPRKDNVGEQVLHMAIPPNIYDTVAAWAPDNLRVARMTYRHNPNSGFAPLKPLPPTKALVVPPPAKDTYSTRIEILDYKVWPTVLTKLELDEFVTEFKFSDNNHLVCKGIKHTFTFRRNHPEWWWGHFYRIELWLLAALTLFIAYKFIRHIRAWLQSRRRARV